MNLKDKNAKPTDAEDREVLEPELRQALDSFQSTVTAWSEAMMSRPREVRVPEPSHWVRASKWALGCLVFAATVSGGVYQNYHQREVAKAEAAAAALRAAEHERELAAQRSKEQSAEDLMAKVDSDISREVPSALEPLATLMTDEQAKGN